MVDMEYVRTVLSGQKNFSYSRYAAMLGHAALSPIGLEQVMGLYNIGSRDTNH